MTKILITGHNGFIGSHLDIKLKKKFYLKKLDYKINKRNSIKFIKSDRSDIVIHTAAKTNILKSWNIKDDIVKYNLELTKRVIEYCLKNDSFLIFLSSYLYGNALTFPTSEEAEIKVNNPYAISKKICEEECLRHASNSGLRLTVIRPFNIYGYQPRSNQIVMNIINQIINDNKIKINDLHPKRDMLYIEDFCTFIELIIEKLPKNQIFNVGSGLSISIQKMVEKIKEVFDSSAEVIVSNKVRPNEIYETQADISKAKNYLNWKPIWSFEDGIKDIKNKIKL